MRLHQDHGIPMWDAMLLKTYQYAGASIYLSEDLQHGRSIDSLRVVNPFAPDAAPIETLLGLHETAAPWRRKER